MEPFDVPTKTYLPVGSNRTTVKAAGLPLFTMLPGKACTRVSVNTYRWSSPSCWSYNSNLPACPFRRSTINASPVLSNIKRILLMVTQFREPKTNPQLTDQFFGWNDPETMGASNLIVRFR